MKKDDIEHMWKLASNDPNHDTNWHDPVVVKFAELVAAKKREECAKLCEDDDSTAGDWHWEAHVGGYFARKIREEPEA